MTRQADVASTAYFWIKVSSIWPICIVLVLHFALVYTKNPVLKNKVTYAILYLPALAFSSIALTTHLFGDQPVLRYWGYDSTPPASNWVNTSSLVWAAIISISVLLICAQHYLSAKDNVLKQQAKFVTIGLSVPVIVAIVTGIVFPELNIQFPELGNIFTPVLAIFVGYAIWKFRLFSLDPALVADNIITTMPDPLILTDNQGKILTANKAVKDFSGYEENEIVGKPLDLFYKPKSDQNKGLAEILGDQTFRGLEIKIKTKTGIEKSALFSSSVIKNSKGHKIGVVCVLQDITELKRMKDKLEQYSMHLESLVEERTVQLEQAQAQLVKSERLAAIGELAGMVGHDLRNPLTGIKNAAYYLKKKGAECPESQAKEMLEIINKAIDHSNKIINDLLDYAREMHLELTECAPRTLVEEATRMIQVPDRIQIVNKVLEETKVKVDADKIMRVFINLIKNAIDAMPEKGTLEIRSGQTKDNVEIAFADTGMGIPDEALPKIFTPLFTTKAQGMGFGLAICKRIVESHGGTITVKTEVNKGTTFTITLPIKPKVEVGDGKTWINMPESLLSTTTKAQEIL
jgi:PAS domain S-box-containing protein